MAHERCDEYCLRKRRQQQLSSAKNESVVCFPPQCVSLKMTTFNDVLNLFD